MAKPSFGVIVGRFQVNALHKGHLALFNEVASRHNRVMVFIGVSPSGLSKDHPLDFAVREAMIKESYPDFIVQPLRDCRTDELWSEQLDVRIGSIADFADVTLYGGRDSFLPHYKGRYKPVELTMPANVVAIKGTDIRTEFSDKVLKSSDFRAGMIYAEANMWPALVPTVDIAALHQGEEKLELLLIRKKGEITWRFPGGHAEISNDSYEADASRELYEETHVNGGEMVYVGSANINDWRYAAVPDRKIRTVLFRTFTMSLSATAGDDASEVRWFDTAKITTFNVVEEHVGLLTMLMLDLKQKGLLSCLARSV